MAEDILNDSDKKNCSCFITKIARFKLGLLDKVGQVINILPRVVMANVFFSSGVLKLPDGFLGIGKGDWDTTLLLFEDEHPVPFLSYELAAYLGTGFEIIAPVMLVLGFGSRIAAVILLSMTAVIEFTYKSSVEHLYWATMLFIVLFSGPGKISIDYFIRKKFLK